MAKSYVKEQADKLVAIINKEHTLKVELLNLDLQVDVPEMQKSASDRQWEILGQLRSLNMDEKLPIIRNLANFIIERRKQLGIETSPKDAAELTSAVMDKQGKG